MRFPDDVPTLTDGTVTLRAHVAADVQGCWEQCQDPVSQRWTTVPVPYRMADAEEYVVEVLPGGWRSDEEWAFAVEAADESGTSRFAGTVSLRNHGNGRAEVAYGSHPWARGKGHLHRAVRLLLTWGFTERRLRTVIWWANRGNWASRRLAWRLGFDIAPGTVPQWLPQRGELLDAWVGTLRADDQRQPRHPWCDPPRIAGRQVALRPHAATDVPRIQEACADERTASWLADLPQPYTRDDAAAWLERLKEVAATGAGVAWAVVDPVTDLLLGSISLVDLKPGDDAEVGYWSHPEARGRGVMTQACGLVVRHAFVAEEDGGLGLRRLKVFAAEGNTASRHVIEATGFTETGRARADTRLRGGVWVDTVCYDLLASEYRLSSAG